jgi:RNA polymerase sigma-70 factor (ECF subfamily)
LSGDAAIAEDLAQETLLAALKKVGDFRGSAYFVTWLHKIAYSKFIDSKRRLGRHAAKLNGLKDERPVSNAHIDPLEEVMAGEQSRLLYRAVRKLEEAEQAAIVLHYFQRLSFSEMSKVLEEPVGTVKWRTSQALRKLKSSLSTRK